MGSAEHYAVALFICLIMGMRYIGDSAIHFQATCESGVYVCLSGLVIHSVCKLIRHEAICDKRRQNTFAVIPMEQISIPHHARIKIWSASTSVV